MLIYLQADHSSYRYRCKECWALGGKQQSYSSSQHTFLHKKNNTSCSCFKFIVNAEWDVSWRFRMVLVVNYFPIVKFKSKICLPCTNLKMFLHFFFTFNKIVIAVTTLSRTCVVYYFFFLFAFFLHQHENQGKCLERKSKKLAY